MLGAAQALISRSRTVHGPAERCGPFFTLNMGSTLHSHEERGGKGSGFDNFMIDATRQVHTWFTCHEGKNNTECTMVKLSKPDPIFFSELVCYMA